MPLDLMHAALTFVACAGTVGPPEIDESTGLPANHRYSGMDAIGAVALSRHLHAGSSGDFFYCKCLPD